MIKIIIYPLKLVMMAAPFLSLILILGTLWGVVGKTTYKDISGTVAQATEASKAGNVLVKETQNAAACAKPIVPEANFNENGDTVTEDKANHGNVDWERIV